MNISKQWGEKHTSDTKNDGFRGDAADTAGSSPVLRLRKNQKNVPGSGPGLRISYNSISTFSHRPSYARAPAFFLGGGMPVSFSIPDRLV
jgi:hypothetical protein